MRRALPLGTWAVGVLAYLIAVANRTSLSALGVDTADHFHIDPVMLSLFAVLQLGVYGVCQIPVGLLLDRLGPKTVLVCGIVLLVVAQGTIALSPGVGPAIAARALLGAGDATVFPSVLRIIGIRFPRRLAPVAVQVTGLVGQLGQLISVVPLATLVRRDGWTVGFLVLAGVTLLVALLVGRVVSERSGRAASGGAPRPGLRAAWKMRSTRLGFWVHAATPFSANAFAVLWGAPYLAAVGGLDQPTVIALLGISTLVGLLTGPLLGALSSALPGHRVGLALAAIAIQAAAWVAVSFATPPIPVALLLVLVGALGLGGPASLLAFDIVRQHAPTERISTATGVVNAGGFATSVVVVFAIGGVLALAGAHGANASPGAYRQAELVQLPVWAICAAMILLESRPNRRRRSPDPDLDRAVPHETPIEASTLEGGEGPVSAPFVGRKAPSRACCGGGDGARIDA